MKQLIFLIAIVLLPVLLHAQPEGWGVNSSDFEFSMTLTAFAKLNGTEYTEEGDYLAAFVGDECRGVAEATYVEEYENYLYFLTVFSNAYSGEDVVFKCFDASEEKTLEGFNPAGFFDGNNVGTAASPAEISDEVFVGIDDLSAGNETSIQVYPNPVADVVTIEAAKLVEVLLMDMTGRVIKSRESKNSKAEISVSSLPKGLYFLNIKTVDGKERIRKILVQ